MSMIHSFHPYLVSMFADLSISAPRRIGGVWPETEPNSKMKTSEFNKNPFQITPPCLYSRSKLNQSSIVMLNVDPVFSNCPMWGILIVDYRLYAFVEYQFAHEVSTSLVEVLLYYKHKHVIAIQVYFITI